MTVLSAQEVSREVNKVIDRYGLSYDQFEKVADSVQLNNILLAAHVGRWDQVTLMLIQDGVITKWPA